ncbi:MAG TPA: transglutaminase family protein [Cyclobacteriaceae bacterium]
MPKFKIRHITRYVYEGSVRDSANQIMLYPIQDEYQEVAQQNILITGSPQVDIHVDYFNNKVGTFTQSKPHLELTIDSQVVVVTLPKGMPDDNKSVEEQWRALEELKYSSEFIDFLKQESFRTLPEVAALVEEERLRNCSPLVSAKAFCHYVFTNFLYKKGITTVETTLDEAWKIKSGVCQDFAHILLVMLRLMNIPARYVSGYICPNKNGMRGEGATHAWVEAYLPFYGWLGLDPTNDCMVNEMHVKLAVGKNFTDCSPVKGTYRGSSNHTMEVAVSVSYEDGQSTENISSVEEPQTVTSFSKNSYRRHQEEMQMQQQQ